MSPSMTESLRAIAACDEEVRELKHRAINGRDVGAALALIDVAAAATRAVHDLWNERRIYDPSKRGVQPSDDLAERRELLAFHVGTEKPFPTLHHWAPDAIRRKLEADQAVMLHGLEFGPKKGLGRKGSKMRMLLDVVTEIFEGIQQRPDAPRGVEGEIWRLPPLGLETRAAWAGAVVAWLWSRPRLRRRLRRPGSDLYSLANPARELARDRRKAEKRLDDLIAIWKKEDGWPLGVVRASRRLQAIERIRLMHVTDAHLRNGLRDQIIAYWGRNLVR
jgi:hypothetical protein